MARSAKYAKNDFPEDFIKKTRHKGQTWRQSGADFGIPDLSRQCLRLRLLLRLLLIQGYMPPRSMITLISSIFYNLSARHRNAEMPNVALFCLTMNISPPTNQGFPLFQ